MFFIWEEDRFFISFILSSRFIYLFSSSSFFKIFLFREYGLRFMDIEVVLLENNTWISKKI